MKPIRPPSTWLLAAVLLLLFAGTAAADEQLYTCGMHPQIIRKEPGDCPICGMPLTPLHRGPASAASEPERRIKYYKSTMMAGEVKPGPGKDSMGMDMEPVYEEAGATADARVQLDAATVQRMNLRLGTVKRGPVTREIRTVGSVAFAEDGAVDITLKYDGWIEKMTVNTTWTLVQAGDPLFEVYSPELYSTELDYVSAMRAGGGPLADAARAKLKLFDLPDDAIAELGRTGEVKRTHLFRSPAAGVVVEKIAVPGQMMKAGERIYRLADLSTVWVEAQVYEQDLAFVRANTPVRVRASHEQEMSYEARVQQLLPRVQEQTRTATARIILPNTDGRLLPGMFVDVTFDMRLRDDAVLVPESAILRSGEHNTVFVALDGGYFEPREVVLGSRSTGDFYEVLAGLKGGENVVVSGQFMLDSESRLQEAIRKMLRNNEPSAVGKKTADGDPQQVSP